MSKPRAKCPECGFDSMSVCRCGIPSLSNERNTMKMTKEEIQFFEAMRAPAKIMPEITGLYKTERPLVYDHTWEGNGNPAALYVIGEQSTEVHDPDGAFER